MQTNNKDKTAGAVVEGKKEKPEEEEHDFNWFQKWVCPIHLRELAVVLPVVLLMATALFVYTGYRDVKDPIVIGGEGQGLMTVQYCKMVVMMVAIPVAAIFLKLDNMVSRDFIFFQTVLTFASFFLLNGLCLYPYRDALHSLGADVIRSARFNMDESNIERVLPLLGTVIFPINTLTYVFSEMWGTISVSFLVWGYCNQVTPKQAARRYYAVLGLGGQFGALFGGMFVGWLTKDAKKSPTAFVQNMMIVNMVMTALCVVFAAVFAFLQYYVMRNPKFADLHAQNKDDGKKKKGGKPKMSVGEAFKYCLSNPYVLALCGMVFAYGFVMVLGELTYKDLMNLAFSGDQNSYASFKAVETSASSIVAIILMIFVGHNVIRLFGWLATALLTPAIAGLLACLMYLLTLFGPQIYSTYGSAGDIRYDRPDDAKAGAYLDMLKWFGLAFVVATKSMKYSSFDPAKELAFLALNSEQKYKAKAAVDIIGARLGKGGGALFNILLLNIALSSKVSYITSCLIVSFIGVGIGILMWISSDVYIARNKDRIAEENKKEAMKNAEPLESVQVEGKNGTGNETTTPVEQTTGVHIEMSDVNDASFTTGQAGKETPMPSRQNTPEQQ